MASSDPHSYSDLSQGRIRHIDFHIRVDFQGRVLQVRADYRMEAPVSGSLFLDSRGVEIDGISSGGKPIEYEMDAQDPILGERLCLRDLDLIRQFKKIDVGFSLGTHDERIKALFEPRSPSLKSRAEALRAVHRAGVGTYAFIGPMLPLDPKALVSLLDDAVDEVLIDRMNYANKVKTIYRRAGLESYLEEDYFRIFGEELKERFEEKGVTVSMCY